MIHTHMYRCVSSVLVMARLHFVMYIPALERGSRAGREDGRGKKDACYRCGFHGAIKIVAIYHGGAPDRKPFPLCTPFVHPCAFRRVLWIYRMTCWFPPPLHPPPTISYSRDFVSNEFEYASAKDTVFWLDIQRRIIQMAIIQFLFHHHTSDVHVLSECFLSFFLFFNHCIASDYHDCYDVRRLIMETLQIFWLCLQGKHTASLLLHDRIVPIKSSLFTGSNDLTCTLFVHYLMLHATIDEALILG